MIEVSVIVPIFNAKNYLEKCIDSIVSQSYKDITIILVDDGSTDGSSKMCDEYALNYNNIKVIHKENEGLICARITGLEHANSTYITFVDADDWIEPDHISELVGGMEEVASDIVVEGCIIDESNKSRSMLNKIEIGLYEGKHLEYIYMHMLYYSDFFEFGIMPYMWNKLFKRELLLDCYADIDTSIYDGEDCAVVYSYLLKCKSVLITEDCTYHYLIRSESMSHKRKDNFIDNSCKLYKYMLIEFKKSKHYDILKPQLDNYMRMMIDKSDYRHSVYSKRYYFPFSKVGKGSNVIIYGAGVVGENYIYDLKMTGYCNPTLWVDKNWENIITYSEMSISSPEEIVNCDYDYIIIALSDECISLKVKTYLIEELNVAKEKIIF